MNEAMWFKTRKGTVGLLQFLGYADPSSKSHGVRIRYKLVERTTDKPSGTALKSGKETVPGTVSESDAIAWGPPVEKSGTPRIRNEESSKIAAQRIETLEAMVRAVEANLAIGYAKLSDLYNAQNKLFDAQPGAAKSKAERIAIWEKLLKTRQEMEKKAEALVKQIGTGPDERAKADLLRARGAPKGRTRLGRREGTDRRIDNDRSAVHRRPPGLLPPLIARF